MVSEFLAEEKKMLAWMEGEKRKYLNAPERHQDYTSEWNYFYEKKCQEERVKVHPSMIRLELKILECYTLPTAEILSGKNVRALVSMVSYLKK